MANNITSIYDGDKISVDSMIADPTWIAQRVIQNLDGAFLVDAVFRDGGSNQGVVAFREAAAPFLNDEVENVAEFGEIPVSDLNIGKVRTVIAQKIAQAVRVSFEMRNFNKIDLVNQQVTALQNNVLRASIRAGLAAFNASNVPDAAASASWGTTGDPIKDVFDAIDAIQGANVDGDDTRNFGYSPDTIVAHPRAVTALLRNEKVQSKYIGDAASANPLYTGQLPQTVFGLNVLQSRYMDPTEVIVLEAGTVGFRSDAIPMQMTPLYAEGGGPDSSGGPTMSFRSDCFQSRVYAVDNPKAAFRITGIS